MEAMLPAFPPFDPYSDPTSLAQRWTKWQARFDNFLLAANIQNAARKRAMLLHYAGDAVHGIFLTLPDRGTDYETAVAKLNGHFAPRKNAVYERHVSRQAKQSSEETVDQFQVRLRKLAATCEFANEEQEIVSQMIEGTNSAKLRRSALRERDVTLEKLMEIGRSLETAELQATSMEGRERVEPVQKVTNKKQWRRNAPSSNQSEHKLVTEHSSVDAKKEFPKLFGKVGRLKNFQVKLNISQDVQPVVRQHRRILFQMRKALETELTRLEELDIIEKVTGPTPWVPPIVIVPKRHDPNTVRMWVDMREANVAIARERHVMPTVEDVISILNGAAYFSKLDLKEGYHQLELAEESRVITTFSTHCGLRRYKRL
ncbi:uncharacterized protein LOC142588176 [Dermacentor variabilis]|uniref:uncharacterized protein LOC142588176 n=1 Tax=Dermacentor variabilis TaxID=34621 RepID=UPI003F5C42BA